MRPSLLEQWERQKSASLPKKATAKSATTKVAPSAKRFVSAPKVSKVNYGNEPLRGRNTQSRLGIAGETAGELRSSKKSK